MSDDPVESFVDGTVEPFGDESDDSIGPQARDMEAELRDRTGATPGDSDDLTEVDSETATAFWGAVVYVNFGILLISVAPVVYALRGRPLISGVLVIAGVALLARAYFVYRAFEAAGEEDSETGENVDHGDDRDDA